MTTELEIGLYIFMLAGFLGYHVITRVPPLLHTPLMSATNAISGISLIGSLVIAGANYDPLSTALGVLFVIFLGSKHIQAKTVLTYLYIISAVLFILGLKGLSSPRWARQGMFLAEFGMAVAIIGTLFDSHIQGYVWIAIGLAIGTVVGGSMGLRIPMTAVPQRTALS